MRCRAGRGARWLSLTALTLALTGCDGSKPTPRDPPVLALDDPNAVLAQARQMAQEDRPGEAEQLLSAAISRFPGASELVVERAKLLSTIGRNGETIRLLSGLSARDPRVLNLLGYAELMEGRTAEGRAHLEQAAQLAEQAGRPYAPAYYHLGLQRIAAGDLDGARQLLERAVASSETHLEARYQLLNVLQRLGLDDAAARREFARVYEPLLRQQGALEDDPAEPSNAVSRRVELEWRPQVAETRFERTFAADALVEIGCRVDAPAWFRATLLDGPGAGTSLLDVVHAGERDAAGQFAALWIPHVLELPSGPAGSTQTVRFEVGPAARWKRWLGSDPPAGARFSEPSPLAASAASRSADPRPNLLILSLDTLRADRLGCYGNPRDTSPTIDALASSGVRFARAEAQSNWTLPAHYSIFSGLDPIAHGVLPDLESTRGYLFPDRRLNLRGSGREQMLAERLKQAGYRTAAVTENGWVSGRFGFDQGFDLYRSDLRGWRDATRDAAVAELESFGSGGPWMLFVHTYTTHQPYHAPRALRTRYTAAGHVGFAWPAAQVPIRDYNRFRLSLFPPAPADIEAFRALYDGQVRYVDELVGSLTDWLARRGLREQTVIVITSDHGEELFERGQFDHGDTLYEEVSHVPLVLNAPGRLPAGRTVDAAVSLGDLAATMLDLAGVGTELGQGRSLRPVWEGGGTPAAAYAAAIGHGGEPLFAVWDGGLKYIRRDTAAGRREQLFELERDRGERVEASARRPADLLRLREALEQRIAAGQAIRQALGAEQEELDPETIERLKSLGYAR